MKNTELSARKFFERVEVCADPESAGITDAVVQFVLDGTDDGVLYCMIRKGKAKVHTGYHELPDVVIRTTLQEWIMLSLGKIGPFRAYLSGNLEVKGDIVLAQRILKFFRSTMPFEENLQTDIPDDNMYAPGMTGFVWDLSSEVIRKGYES